MSKIDGQGKGGILEEFAVTFGSRRTFQYGNLSVLLSILKFLHQDKIVDLKYVVFYAY